ncbi:hypothetical protein SAMN04487850_1963 [Prevotella aff. ruminicola Tc2-24]|uniref:Uncharacterized protein n=1 Tax=Prevotella aff. ruminicola Tc2-24 TaxID=81582 RepID=A0A1I0PV96_9BACT|nr:hypothetical protein SAMN04487850_1963 [Prevotella aff. ruminicola Tc2-24]
MIDFFTFFSILMQNYDFLLNYRTEIRNIV